MKQPVFYTAGDTAALRYARNILCQWGYTVSDNPCDSVTHLLLPVPSFEADGILKGGIRLLDVLKTLPSDVEILGGNLPPLPYHCADFLQDKFYLEENAAITANCAVNLIRQHREHIRNAAVLIIGWGRIGKRLAAQLKDLDARITVSVRREIDQQNAGILGYDTVEPSKWDTLKYDIVINTAPAPLLDQQETREDTLLMDLASIRGIAGDRVIWAKGLPSKDAPDISGILIAKTALRYALRKEQL